MENKMETTRMENRMETTRNIGCRDHDQVIIKGFLQ